MGLRLFVDFDGTVTTDDVGNLFFRTFGGPVCDTLVRRYRAGEISAQECFRGETTALGLLPVERAKAYVREQPVRQGLRELVEFCRIHGVPLRILSDGLDFYIGEILRTHEIRDVPVSSNILRLEAPDADGLSAPEILFPHDDVECRRCACCKRNVLVSESGDDDVIAYVGDGFSDMCAVRYADIVFARGELQTACQRENTSYYHYETLIDVRDRLGQLLSARRLRKRLRAARLRKALFEGEP